MLFCFFFSQINPQNGHIWMVMLKNQNKMGQRKTCRCYYAFVVVLWNISCCSVFKWIEKFKNITYCALCVTSSCDTCKNSTLFYSPSPPDTTNYIVAEIKMKFFFLQCSTSKVWKAFKIPQSFKSADFAKSCKYIQWISSIGPDCL